MNSERRRYEWEEKMSSFSKNAREISCTYEQKNINLSADILFKFYSFLETQKRQWLAGMPFSNDASINPIAILYEFDWIEIFI